MKIAVFNLKGGVGKTTLSVSLAIDLKMYLISNDDSVIMSVYDYAKIMKEPKLIENCIYDFGGFVDDSVNQILPFCDLVLIPLTADLNSFKKTISSFEQIQNKNKNIVFVANRAEKEDFEEIKKFLKKYELPIFEIRESRIWKKTFEQKKSVLEIKNDSKASNWIYRNSVSGYIELLNFLKIKIEKKN